MYLETMERVLGPMDKTIVDTNGASRARALYLARRADNPRREAPSEPSLSGLAIAVVAVVALVIALMSTFVVDPTEQALVLRFGQPVRDLIGAPGLYFKWPFIDTVVYIDKRILALDNERQEVLVSDNQRLEVDAFVRYRIADPLLFYQSVFNTRGADAQLGGMLNSALRRTLSEASITDIVRDKRDALMADIRDQMIAGAKRFGIDVIDVRIKRADLPAENSEAVFRRMQTERQQRAASYRAQGSQQASRSGRRRTARSPSSPRRRSSSPSRSAARATASETASSPRPMAPTRSSSPSTARCRPIRTRFKDGQTRSLVSPKSDFFRYFSTPTPPPKRRRRGGAADGKGGLSMRDFAAAIGLVFAIEGC